MNDYKTTAGRKVLCCAVAAVFAGIGMGTSTAKADTGAELLLSPWQERHSLELETDFFIQGRGHVREPDGSSIRINTYESSGRFRISPEERHSPAVGFDLYHVSLSHDDPDLPQRLSDQSLGVGFGITEWNDWEIGATLAFGFAGDLPYSDKHAWYGKGNLIATRRLDERSALTIGLNYDGNRTLFPDIPLPGVAYSRQVSETLRYTAGVPYSSIHWQPRERLTIEAEYTMLFQLDLTVSYELIEGLAPYGGFYNRFNAFHRKDDDPNRRVFFQQRRLEAGVRYAPIREVELLAAGGYAFDQRLRRGWDVRDLSTVAKFSNEPYLRLGFEVGF